MSGPRGWVFLAIIFIVSIALRLVSLDSDPPRPITGGPSPNEGLYIENARNLVLDGRWKLDDWNSTVIQPLGSALTSSVFRSAGVGLRQARLVSVVLSVLVLVVFYILLREASGPITGFLGALLLGTNGIFLIYSRQAGPAPLSILLMLLTILLWRLGKRHPIFASFAGMMLVLSALIENGSNSLFFVTTAALATLMVRLQAWKMPWSGVVRHRVRTFWWAAMMTLVVWILIFVVPNKAEFNRMLNTAVSSARWGNVALNLFMAPFNFGPLLQWTPIICVLALVYILTFARSLMAPIARHNPISETRVWLFAWLITGPLVIAARSDRRLHVLVLLVPVLCATAAEALNFILSVRRIRKPHVDILVVIGMLALFTWIFVQVVVHSGIQLGFNWIPRGFYRHQNRYEFLLVLGIAAPVTWMLAKLWLRWKKFTFDMSPGFASGLFVALLVGMLLTSASVARAIFNADHDVVSAASTISELPHGSVVGGTWAPLLTLDSGLRGLVIWREINGQPDTIDRNGVTHLLLQRGSSEDLERNPVFRNRPDIADRLQWLRLVHVGRYDLDLYAVSPRTPLISN